MANGATRLYLSLVDPALTRHEQEIDTAFEKAQEQAANTGTEWGRKGLAKLQQAASDGLLKGQHMLSDQIGLTSSEPSGPTSNTQGRVSSNASGSNQPQERTLLYDAFSYAFSRIGLSSAEPTYSGESTQERSVRSEASSHVRRRSKKVNSNSSRRSVALYQEENVNRRVNASSNSMDNVLSEEELKRRQTQALGLTNYLAGYFSKATTTTM
ncbi:2060_t:CDS:2 [Acaulospora colombiana]|uniref:2060_t:CDS:1 n=1 Tax=Acaulospora colombiana TaxID=27376 RepID=A0ACA9LN71_9GLOM|nr:2060_t:CDS:2 [Acaulospora colombiana]